MRAQCGRTSPLSCLIPSRVGYDLAWDTARARMCSTDARGSAQERHVEAAAVMRDQDRRGHRVDELAEPPAHCMPSPRPCCKNYPVQCGGAAPCTPSRHDGLRDSAWKHGRVPRSRARGCDSGGHTPSENSGASLSIVCVMPGSTDGQRHGAASTPLRATVTERATGGAAPKVTYR